MMRFLKKLVLELLKQFLIAVKDDGRIGPTHISLFAALAISFYAKGQKNPVVINRQEIMKGAKVNSRHTYNVCLNQLDEYGYIKYLPSLNPAEGSMVYLHVD